MNMNLRRWRDTTLTAALLQLIFFAVATGNEVADAPPIRYRVPAFMMVTWAEWPEERKHQDSMAQFVRSHGFNCVEVDIKQLETCRRNGLYARLGNVGLEEAAKLKGDKAVKRAVHQ